MLERINKKLILIVLNPLLDYKLTSKKTKEPPKRANHKGNIEFLGPLWHMRSGHCYFPLWLLCQVDFSCLPTTLCQIAKSTWPDSQVNIARGTFPSWHIAILLFGFFCQIANCDSPYGLPEWFQAAHRFLIFWAVKGLNVFFGLPKLFSKTAPFSLFFHGLPRAPPFSLPSLFLHF